MNDNTAKILRDVFLSGAHTYLPPKHYCSAFVDFRQQIQSISDYISKAGAYRTFNTCKATLKVKVSKVKKRAQFIATESGILVIGRINNQITDFIHDNPIIYVCFFSDDRTEYIAQFVSLPKENTIKVTYSSDNGIHSIDIESNDEWQRIHFDEGFADTVMKEKSSIVRQCRANSKKLPSIKNITCSGGQQGSKHCVQVTTDEDQQLEQASACLPSEHHFIFYRGQLCLI